MAKKTSPVSVPAWLTRRLANVMKTDIRYEASLYGPLSGYFDVFFPKSNQFLVKPQSHILPGVPMPPPSSEEAIELFLPYHETVDEGEAANVGGPGTSSDVAMRSEGSGDVEKVSGPW